MRPPRYIYTYSSAASQVNNIESDNVAIYLAVGTIGLSVIAALYLWWKTAPARSSNYRGAPLSAQTVYNTAIRRCQAQAGPHNSLLFRCTNFRCIMKINEFGEIWNGQKMDTTQNRAHTEANKMMSSFFYGIAVGYFTYIVCCVPYIFCGLLGNDWKRFEIIWLNSNAAVCGLVAVVVWHYIDQIMHVALDTSVLIFIEENIRSPITGSVENVILPKEKSKEEVAKKIASEIMKHQVKKIKEWDEKSNDEATDSIIGIVSTLGQIVVVEISVIFVNVTIIIFAAWSKHSGTERSNSIIDALNAGALIAWLIVVGLTVSMAINANSCYTKMQARIREAALHSRRAAEHIGSAEKKARNNIYIRRDEQVTKIITLYSCDNAALNGPNAAAPADVGDNVDANAGDNAAANVALGMHNAIVPADADADAGANAVANAAANVALDEHDAIVPADANANAGANAAANVALDEHNVIVPAGADADAGANVSE